MDPRPTSTQTAVLPDRRPEARLGADAGRVLVLGAAFVSLLASVYLYFSGSREQGIFVGLWVPSILSAGALMVGGGSRE